MFEIPITNKTMELSDCKDAWFFDEKYRVWCLEDILYTEKATTPKFQRLSIFVPEAYMKANGAFMDESDCVYASQIYCPIVDLEHADLAYEWLFGVDKENEDSPAGPAGVMNPFQEALSKELSGAYIEYFNGLGLKHPETGETLVIGEDGRSGGALDYLMEKLNESATIYLTKLCSGELPERYSAEDYLSGNYTYEMPAPMGNKDDDADLMQGHAGPGVSLNKPPVGDKLPAPPTLGDMVSRPPKGVDAHPFVPPTMEVQGKDKKEWLSWDGSKAVISDIDSYILKHRRRMKPCTSFDVLGMDSGENKVFGNAEIAMRHFNSYIAPAIERLKDQFPEEYVKYHDAYAAVSGNEELDKQKYLINPFNYIGTGEKSMQAQHYCIRVGAGDADTSFSVSMTLACLLAEAGKNVDYALVWDQPHCEADYPGEAIAWIEEILKEA